MVSTGQTRGDGEGIAQTLCRALEDDIVTGRLVPGTRLEENQLAARFSVSRTPVREALQLLAATDLAQKVPNRGVTVATVTPDRLTAMFEAMAELEGICGRLAAERMLTAERQALDALHQRLADPLRRGDATAYEAGNRAFHNLLYAGAHSDVLVEVTKAMRRRVSPFRRVQFNSLSRLASSYDEHQHIVQAILRGDADRSQNLLRDHIMAVHAVSQDYLRSLQRAG